MFGYQTVGELMKDFRNGKFPRITEDKQIENLSENSDKSGLKTLLGAQFTSDFYIGGDPLANSARVSGPSSASALDDLHRALGIAGRHALLPRRRRLAARRVGAVRASSHGWSSRPTRCSVPRISHATTTERSSVSAASTSRAARPVVRARRARRAARRSWACTASRWPPLPRLPRAGGAAAGPPPGRDAAPSSVRECHDVGGRHLRRHPQTRQRVAGRRAATRSGSVVVAPS